MGAAFSPSHLLLFHEMFTDYRVDSGLHEASGDALAISIAVSIVGYKIRIILDIGNHVSFGHPSSMFLGTGSQSASMGVLTS
jgi:hypothetical protein